MKRFYLKQNVFSFRDTFKVFDADQKVVYHAQASFVSLPRQYHIYRSSDDRLLFNMKRRLFHFMPTYELYDATGNVVATMHKQFAFFKNIIDIQSKYGSYSVEGNFWTHVFSIEKDNKVVLAVKKRLLAWGDTYEIEIDDNEDTDMMIAFVIMIDSIYHRGNNK